MGYISKDQIEDLKSRIDIVDLISGYIPLKPAGSNYKGLCPFHQEKTPSFMVNRARKNFHCFGCHEGGDAISFIMKIENLSYVEAIKFIADKLGIILEETKENKEKFERKTRLYKINLLAARYYYRNLLTNKIPQEYIKKRGLDKRILNEYFLGYSGGDNGLLTHMRNNKVREEDLLELGLIARSNKDGQYYEKFRNRLIFPIINSQKNIIGFGARTMGDSKIKYLNSPESEIFKKRENLYGISTVQKNRGRDKIVLVEGYMDVIGLYNAGIPYALASLGTALSEDQARLIKRYGNNVYIAYDGDEAGQKATIRAIDIFMPLNINLNILEFPNSMDPDEFVSNYGKEEFEKLFSKAKKPLDFKLDYLSKRTSNKIDLIKEVIDFLASIPGNVIRDMYVSKTAKYLEVSRESLQRDLDLEIEKRSKYKSLKNIENKSLDFSNQNKGYNKSIGKSISSIESKNKLRLERELVIHSLKNKDSFYYLYDLSKDFIDDPKIRLFYDILENFYKNSDEGNKEELFTTKEFLELAINIDKKMGFNDKVNYEILDEILSRIELFKYRSRKREIQNKLLTDISIDERDCLTRELTEIMQKLT